MPATKSNPLTHRFNEMDLEIAAWEEDAQDPSAGFTLIVETSAKDQHIVLKATDDFKLTEVRRTSKNDY